MTEKQIGIIILAAGASSRIGSPKQLLPFKGATLLQHSLAAAAETAAGCTILVLGAGATKVRSATGGIGMHIVVNEEWEEGMASSIRCGLETLMTLMPDAEATVIMLCDQPFVTTALLNELVGAALRTDKPIIASTYGNATGVPALFRRSVFPDLMLLTGDVGARKVIQQRAGEVETVTFLGGEVDIDTPADLHHLSKQ